MKIVAALVITCLSVTAGPAQEKEMSSKNGATKASEAGAVPATAQGDNLKVPEGWVVRLDRPDASVTIGDKKDDDIFFVSQEPGWHITTHQSAIYYRPANVVEGSFTASTSISLFDPGTRNREGFGLFVGGKNLDKADQQYVYFLLRNTGDFLIKSRNAADTSVLQDWTHTDAMMVHPHNGTESVENRLEIHAAAESVSFLVNGTEVAKLSRKMTPVEGIVGLRVNHGLNLQVSDLSIEM